MKDKIIHLTHTDILKDSRVLKEVATLTKAGYTVMGSGISMSDGSKNGTKNFGAELLNIQLNARKFTNLPRVIRHSLCLFELGIKVIPRAIRQKWKIVHCHDTLMLPIAVIVKIFTGSKLIYDAHELESNRNGLRYIERRIIFWVETLFWPFVDALIVVSPSIQKWYVDNIGQKPSAVILNAPIYDNKSLHSVDYLRRKFEINPDTKIFIYVGILGKGRGIDLIVEAFKHQNIRSHVVFLGYGAMKDELKNISREYANIHVHDSVAHSEVVHIARSADYGLCLIENVSLSDYYCLPNKLFEYCFAGLPIIASDFPDIRSVIDEYNLGRYCKLNAGEIFNCIQAIEGQSSKQQFKDLKPLSWQAQEKKLLGLYRYILDN